jgi:hypothetical protein
MPARSLSFQLTPAIGSLPADFIKSIFSPVSISNVHTSVRNYRYQLAQTSHTLILRFTHKLFPRTSYTSKLHDALPTLSLDTKRHIHKSMQTVNSAPDPRYPISEIDLIPKFLPCNRIHSQRVQTGIHDRMIDLLIIEYASRRRCYHNHQNGQVSPCSEGVIDCV